MSSNLKFICAKPDDSGNMIPNTGCGEINHIYIHLYNYLDRKGEDIYVAFKDDMTFFIDESCNFPEHWKENSILSLVTNKSGGGKKIDVGECSVCRDDVYIFDR
jgi:hypothetical protein